jgi:hypothetical protein
MDSNEACAHLGITKGRLYRLADQNPSFCDRRGRKRVFYPEQIRKLSAIIAPAPIRSPMDAIRALIEEEAEPQHLAGYDRFFSDVGEGTVYLIQCGDRVKIGFASNFPERMRVLRTACPYPVEIIATIDGGRILEQALHIIFKEQRRHGEWFEVAGRLAKVIQNIRSIEYVAATRPAGLSTARHEP